MRFRLQKLQFGDVSSWPDLKDATPSGPAETTQPASAVLQAYDREQAGPILQKYQASSSRSPASYFHPLLGYVVDRPGFRDWEDEDADEDEAETSKVDESRDRVADSTEGENILIVCSSVRGSASAYPD